MSKKEQILEASSQLFEMQGYHATSLSEILTRSETPKGSLYYYFPEGKQGLAVESILRTGELFAERIRSSLAEHGSSPEALRQLMHTIAERMEQAAFRSGGPLTAIAMETATTSETLNRACRAAFELIRQAFEDKLLSNGLTKQKAHSLSLLIVAAIEGGTLLSRTHHSGDALRQVADELAEMLTPYFEEQK